MRQAFILALIVSLFTSCNQSGNTKNENTQSDEEERKNESISTDKYYNFEYYYPKDIFKGKTYRDAGIEFYPIGISDEGLFAHMIKPCDGGCGCCRHAIKIINLTTDKTVAEYDLNKGMDYIEDHRVNWKRNERKLTAFLKKNRVSQVPVEVVTNSTLNFKGHSYEIKITTKKGTDNDDYLGNGTLKYVVRVELDNYKTKTVSRGEFSDGVAFSYLGYIKSPYDDQIALLFNKSYDGWEAEHVNEVVVVGCKLNSDSF